MNTVEQNVDILACPECEGSLTFHQHTTNLPSEGEFGILECRCRQYPVLDSVPIFLTTQVAQFSFGTGAVESAGPNIEMLVKMIEAGQGVEALVECLTFTPTISLLEKLPFWRLWHSGIVPKLTRRWMQRKVFELVQDHSGATAEDWLELYFSNHEEGNNVLLDYYRNRFVLPRTLATYSLLELFPGEERILDVACGLGPFPHYLSSRQQANKVVGFDFNFYLVWWQRQFVAPEQLFLCADASLKLPFKDNVFGGVYCSDSFVYIPNKEGLLQEISRCAPSKPMAITRLGNGDAYPKNWGTELGAETYQNMFGHNTLAYRETDLVRYYLNGVNPLGRDPGLVDELKYDKWLCFITNTTDSMRASQRVGEAPHRIGHSTLNPMFTRQTRADGTRVFRFQFPTIWFAYQNSEMYGYHGDDTPWDSDDFPGLGEPNISTELEELAERFIIIATPPKYLRSNEQKRQS